MSKRFYITTAIDYVNDKPHLGTAYEKIGADAIARYRRRRGFEVRFLMGNDEHSLNVHRAAKKAGLDPLRYCDQMEEIFRGMWSRLDIGFDDFIRTTQPRHRTAVQALFSKILASGDLYPGHYEGPYCESCEAFKKDEELENGLCPIHQSPVARLREENLFFRLSKYTEPLREHFRAHPEFMEPERYRNEMLGLLEGGLEDVSVSRPSSGWGIPVPSHEGQVVWVWFDALINYISALGYGQPDGSLYSDFWPVDVHVIGKDINRFHSVIWPAMLLSAGEPLPRKVWAHGWVHYAGLKMSKSRGTAIALDEAISRHGSDALRYFLLREVAFDRDGDFTWERFDERYNTDLANTWGNLLSRTIPMIKNYRPEGVGRVEGAQDELDTRLEELYSETLRRYCEAMDGMMIHSALEAVLKLLYEANFYVDRKEPWKLAKDPAKAAALDGTLRHLLAILRETALLLAPVLPQSCRKAWTQLGNPGSFDDAKIEPGSAWDRFEGVYHVVRGEALFPRPELKKEENKVEPIQQESKPAETPAQPQAPAADPPKPAEPQFIEYDDFAKVQLLSGKILAAEKVKKSDKLLKLTVDLGEAQPRQIVSGIALSFAPEAIVGKTVSVVANLKPRKIFGLESFGMLLVAQSEGKMELVSPGDLPPGSRIS